MPSKRDTDYKDGEILCQVMMSVVRKESYGDSRGWRGSGNPPSWETLSRSCQKEPDVSEQPGPRSGWSWVGEGGVEGDEAEATRAGHWGTVQDFIRIRNLTLRELGNHWKGTGHGSNEIGLSEFNRVFVAAVWAQPLGGEKAETGAPGQAAAVVQGAMMETIPCCSWVDSDSLE